MVNWPPSQTLRTLKGFLRLPSYYWRFIRNYRVIAKPLTNLLKKGTFQWNLEADQAFQYLKTVMTSGLVLRLLKFGDAFIMETDASDKGIGVVLMQESQPIAFIGKALSPWNQTKSVYEKELMTVLYAIIYGATTWKGFHWSLRQTNDSLKYLLDQRVIFMVQQKGIMKLLGLNYTI